MNIDIDKLISELKIEESNARISEEEYSKIGYNEIEKAFTCGKYSGKSEAFDSCVKKLVALKNEQPEAITDDAHFRKHDVRRSAASNEIYDKGNDPGAASSETQAVRQNEQTKEFDFRCGQGDNRCNCKSPDDCGYIYIEAELSKIK